MYVESTSKPLAQQGIVDNRKSAEIMSECLRQTSREYLIGYRGESGKIQYIGLFAMNVIRALEQPHGYS